VRTKPQMNTDEPGGAATKKRQTTTSFVPSLEFSLQAALRRLKPELRTSPPRRRERGGSVPGSARFQRAWVSNTLHAGCRMRALPGARGGKSLAACKGFSA